MPDYAIYAAFLSSNSELLEDSVLNRLAASTAPQVSESSALGPKVHVELLFVPTSAPVPTIKLGHKVYEDKPSTGARKPRYGNASSQPGVPGESDDLLKGTAVSIHYGGKAFVREGKTFSRANWEFRRVPATPAQAERALAFFRGCEGDGFNKLGFFTEPARRGARRYVSCVPNLFAPTSAMQSLVGGGRRWFCSELCAAGLQHAGILDGHLTASPHPEQFFQEIKRHTTVAAPVQGRAEGDMTF